MSPWGNCRSPFLSSPSPALLFLCCFTSIINIGSVALCVPCGEQFPFSYFSPCLLSFLFVSRSRSPESLVQLSFCLFCPSLSQALVLTAGVRPTFPAFAYLSLQDWTLLSSPPSIKSHGRFSLPRHLSNPTLIILQLEETNITPKIVWIYGSRDALVTLRRGCSLILW